MMTQNLNISENSSQGLEQGKYYLADIKQAVNDALYLPQVRKAKIRPGMWTVRFNSQKARNHDIGEFGFLLEGRLEGDYCYVLDFEHKVVTFKAQPFLLIIKNKGIEHYTPDFLVFYRDGTFGLREIKPEGARNNIEVQKRLASLKKIFNLMDVEFKVIYSDEMHKDYKLVNYQYLWPFLREDEKTSLENMKNTINGLIHFNGRANLTMLKNAGFHTSPAAVARGIYNGKLKLDSKFKWGALAHLELIGGAA